MVITMKCFIPRALPKSISPMAAFASLARETEDHNTSGSNERNRPSHPVQVDGLLDGSTAAMGIRSTDPDPRK